MKTRLLTSFVFLFIIIITFILKFYVSNFFFDALILLILCFASYETSKIFTKMGKFNDKIIATIFPCFAMLTLLLGISYIESIGLLFTLVMVVASIVLFFAIEFFISFFSPKTKIEIKARKMDKYITKSKYSFIKALNTAVIFVYPTFLLLFLTLINHFEEFSSSFEILNGSTVTVSLIILMFAFLIPIFTDTFAYVTGGLIGGKKLAPKISPNKTISGAVGGLLWCVLLSVVVYFILNSIQSTSTILNDLGISLWKIIVIVGISSIVSQIGDLFESWLKRSAGVKDSGNLLPGHGGVLDRFDSYIFVAPIIFISFSILFLV